MMANIGPHLLGRFYVPDSRDWDFERLRSQVTLGTFDDSTADKTVRQLHDTGQLSSWSALLAFWRWLKAFFAKPTPPAPTPTPPPGPVAPKSWEDLITLDQGNTGHCVGFGWAGWGDCAPTEDKLQNADGDAIYYEAKVFDGEPRQENGSTVRSGAKAMKARGKLTAYGFETSLAQVIDWLETTGPVVMGTDWTNGMFYPDGNGIIRPTGSLAGGHCYIALGYDPTMKLLEFQNSWGTGWGRNGRFFMHEADVQTLLLNQGEACAAIEI